MFGEVQDQMKWWEVAITSLQEVSIQKSQDVRRPKRRAAPSIYEFVDENEWEKVEDYNYASFSQMG